MEVTLECVVALTWTLKDAQGEVLDVLEDPVEFLVGGVDLLDKIDEALQGHEQGAKLDLFLEPEDAFGNYDENLVFLAPRSALPTELEEGMGFESLPAGVDDGAPKDIVYTVTEIYPEHVVLDGNHPLAGMAIRLLATVEAVREATEEELTRGTVGTGFFKVLPQVPGNDLLH